MYVADESGTPLGGAAGQRRLLAFLSVVAVAGDAGISREKLAGLLWPDASPERARQSVTQALYDCRRALGVDDLFVTGGDVRLNAAQLTSDVQELEAALDDGELERAVALYQGPFLDGFFLPGSAEFEQWSMLQRTRAEDRIAAALDRLADQAGEAGDLRDVVEWRKRRAALRPLDAASTVALMVALAKVGDRAGAVRHAQLHGVLLREQLGMAPDPTVAALAERLREPVAWEPSAAVVPRGRGADVASAPPTDGVGDGPGVGGTRGPIGHVVEAARAAGSAAAATGAPAEEDVTAVPAARAREETGVRLVDRAREGSDAAAVSGAYPDTAESSPPTDGSAGVAASVSDGESAGDGARLAREARRATVTRAGLLGRWSTVPRRTVGAVAALLAVLLVAVWGAQRARRPAPAVADVRLRQDVVVAPFRVAGASEALAYLRDGLVELLSARLADDTAARTVDAGAVLSAWRRAGLAGSADVPRDTVVRLAARLGARRVVIGSVVGTRTRVVLTADAVDVRSGTVASTATVEGPADSVSVLVDRLAARLLVQEAGEEGALAGQTTASLPALRAFLAGQAAFRRHDLDAALRAYDRAVALDSGFALAALQLVRTADRLQSAEDRGVALARAWRAREALSEQNRAVLLALAGPRYPAPSTANEQLAAWARPVGLTPDRADAWYELGARYLHAGAVVGLPDARPRAAAALRQVLAIDSAYAPARRLLAHLTAAGPAAGAAASADRALAENAGPLTPFVRWRAAVARADAGALARLRDSLPRLGRANLRAIAQASQFDAVAVGDGRRAVELLRARAVRPGDRVEALEADHGLALNEGRLRAAGVALDRLEGLQPGSHAPLRLRVLDALYGEGDPARGAAAAQELARAATPDGQDARAVRVADACVLAQWRLARGDTTGVARAVEALRAEPDALPAAGTSVVAGAPAGLCADLLAAALAVMAGGRDAPALVARLDSLALTPAAAGDAHTYASLFVARLHERLGDEAAALAAVRRRAYMVGWPRYLAASLRAEGRYAARAGAPGVARAAYARYLALQAAPDPELAATVQAVRQALAALAADAG